MTDATRDVKSIFGQALEIPAAAERAAFLDEACGGDAALRAEIDGLLSALDQAGGFLRGPAPVETAAYVPSEGPGTRIGPYKLLQLLGEGGMGTVYLAEQTEPVKRKVAVKIIKPGMDSAQVLARFEAERQALALMDHPNIAKVLDAGTTGRRRSGLASPGEDAAKRAASPTEIDIGRPYFVMELVKGVPFTTYCDENHLTPRERLELFIPVCHAVQHAHQKGIIHRDLKPSNVLIALYDGRPVPKVIDFGLAKALHQNLTERTMFTAVGAVLGTLEYMSPEQAELNNLDIDTRSDVYSLGVILYELLTGSKPLDARRLRSAAFTEMLRIIREEEPQKPSTKLSHSGDRLPSISAQRKTEPRKLSKLVKGDLDWIVMKALEKDRARRYETANGFALDIQRYLADEPVQAGPPGAGYRMRKFAWRHRGQVTAAGVVLLALVAGVIATTWQAVRATRAEAEARAERDAAEEARALADRNFQKARAAVDDYLQEVANDPELKNRGNFHGLRKQLLAGALPFYEQFVKEKSDDPKVRLDQAIAYGRLARLRGEMGEHETAIRDHTKAQEVLGKLAADFPNVPDYRSALAESHHGLGRRLSDLGKWAEAEAAYRQVLALQEKLAADSPAVPDYRNALANSHISLGVLLKAQGKLAAAETAYRQALALQEKLAADSPAVPNYRNAVASCHNNLGLLLTDLGKMAEAEAFYRQALALREKLTADFPAVPAYRNGLAGTHHNLGQVLRKLGKPAEAEAAYRRALVLQEKVVTDFPAVPQYRDFLARHHASLGYLLNDLGKPAEAEAAIRQSLAIRELLAGDFPAVPEYRNTLAGSHNELGALLHALGKRAEAEAAFRRVLAIRQRLVAEFPSVQDYRISLAGCYCNLGDVVRAGDAAAALGWYEQAISLLEAELVQDPRVTRAREFLDNTRSGRAVALAQLGKYEEAIHAARELIQREKVNGGLLYEAAQAFALSSAAVKGDASRQESYAVQAVALLRRAQAAGFFKNGTWIERLKNAREFEALRPREDCRKLLQELEAGTGKAAHDPQ